MKVIYLFGLCFLSLAGRQIDGGTNWKIGRNEKLHFTSLHHAPTTESRTALGEFSSRYTLLVSWKGKDGQEGTFLINSKDLGTGIYSTKEARVKGGWTSIPTYNNTFNA
jgi:hypothetical protein